MFDVPPNDWLNGNARTIKEPYNNHGYQLWLKQVNRCTRRVLFKYSGNQGQGEKKEPKRNSVHGELFKNLKIWQALEKQFITVLLNLTK